MADEKRIIIKRAAPIARSPFVAVDVLDEAEVFNLATGDLVYLGRDVDAKGNSDAAARSRKVTLSPETMDLVRADLVAQAQKISEKDGGLPAGDVVAAVAELAAELAAAVAVDVVPVKG
jgi:hypothetical protein